MSTKGRLLGWVLWWAFLTTQTAVASFRVPPWQVQAVTSGFIGTVEIERAGLGIARVRVLESWKGPAAGSSLNLASEVDPIGGQLRLLLAGERYLVFASPVLPTRTQAPPIISLGYAPNRSRPPGAYRAFVPWQCVPLIAHSPPDGASFPVAESYRSVVPPKQALLRFLAMSPADQEKETLRATFVTSSSPLANAVRQAASTEEVLRIILQPGGDYLAAMSAVGSGGEGTLRALLRLAPAQSLLPLHVLQADIEALCTRHPELATNIALRPNLSPNEELLRMNAMVGRLAQEKYPESQAPQFRRRLDALRRTQTPAAMVGRLSEFASDWDANARDQLIHVIAAGGPQTLRSLEAIPPERFGAGGAVWEEARAYLRLRLGLPAAPRVFGGVDDRQSGQWWTGTASEAQITSWRRELASREENPFMAGAYYQERAFMRLTIHDPGGAVDWLLSLEPGFRLPQGGPDISLIAFYFVDYCRTNRDVQLLRLLTATNPSVRSVVASALAARDPAVALPVLRAMRNAPDGPGDLAAFELARRGDKAAMDRVVQLLKPTTGTNTPPVPSRFAWPVGAEAIALLSNCANASALPQPGDDLSAWWARHRATIALADPWLPATPAP